MTERYVLSEFRRVGRRVHTDLAARVLLPEPAWWTRRDRRREVVVQISTLSTSGVAFCAPDTLDLQVDDVVTFAVGHAQMPIRVRRREPRSVWTTFYAAEFTAMTADMLDELDDVLPKPE